MLFLQFNMRLEVWNKAYTAIYDKILQYINSKHALSSEQIAYPFHFETKLGQATTLRCFPQII
ncbi:hypothetical protein BH18THE2_BH18THE2_39190 [soil metagenome]